MRDDRGKYAARRPRPSATLTVVKRAPRHGAHAGSRALESIMNPVAAWHEEHAYFNRLLHLLQEEVDTLYAGGTPNYELMLDILSYLHEYGDQVHHPREDEAFRRLAYHAPQLRKTLIRLHQEHQVIARAGENLRNLLQEVEADAMMSRAEIEVAAATYLVYYGNHIAREEEEVLPEAARILTEADWIAAKAAAVGNASREPAQRFKALRRRIAAEAA
jgi:hemerythrin-like domain-containing protein